MARAEAQEGRVIRVRTLLATALQLGISAGVMLMIMIQTRVAIHDDEKPRRPN